MISQRKRAWTGHIFRRNLFLNTAIEGRVPEKTDLGRP